MGIILGYREAEGDKNFVQFESIAFSPLNCSQLEETIRGRKSFHFEIKGINIEVTKKDGGVDKYPAGECKLPIGFHHPPKFFAVVEGGWLPLPLITPYNLLADRNVISRLKEINEGKVIDGESQWWLELLRSGDFYINPLPAAIEGFTRSFPSLQEFKDNYQAAVNDLHGFLSGTMAATMVVEFTDAVYAGVYKILSDMHDRYLPAIEFLKQTEPLIARPIAVTDLRRVEDRIFEIADDVGLEKISFVMLAVLSCLYQSHTVFAAAKKILKPTVAGYTDEKIYNVLSDLRILGLYAANLGSRGLMGGGKDARFALATGDQALAFFACSLNIHDVTLGSYGANMKFSITHNNFPSLDEEGRVRLAERLKG